MITLLRKRMHHDLQLAGLAVGTQKFYLRALRQLAAHYHKAPDQLTEEQVDPRVWRQDWVVHSKAVGDGRASLKYLAPYVFRVAISDRRILSCDNGQVTFSYCRSGSNRQRKMTVDAFEFIRRFLQHVLPSGLQTVRHYGFLSPNSRRSIDAVRWLVTLHYGLVYLLLANLSQEGLTKPRIRCDVCGGPMRVLGFLPPAVPAYCFDTS
jgi:Putative transposase/Phage integrase, N-terminal SAM-like domain